MNMVIIGAGSRGMIYGSWAKEHGHTIRAVAELRPDRLEHAAKVLDVPQEMCFRDGNNLLSRERLEDVATIATM